MTGNEDDDEVFELFAMSESEDEAKQRGSQRIAYDKVGDTEIITAFRKDGDYYVVITQTFGGDFGFITETAWTVDDGLNEHRKAVEYILKETTP